ncbi:hypothetical protein K438DRAFT_1754290 [Mycena galopus ATCC 62051]|nr:hypothetical protein K438DRAFT_1754290 [Mycena galopus ATCC 62051]
MSEKRDLPDQGLTEPDSLVRCDQPWPAPGQGSSGHPQLKGNKIVSEDIEKMKTPGQMSKIEQKLLLLVDLELEYIKSVDRAYIEMLIRAAFGSAFSRAARRGPGGAMAVEGRK